MSKNLFLKFAIPLGAIIVIATFIGGFFFFAGDDNCDSGDGYDSVTANAGGGDWTKPGTGAYKNAQALYNFWVKKGMTGAAAAGVVGNVAKESGYTFSLTIGEKGSGIGKGLYQFSNETRTAYEKWSKNPYSSVEDESEYMYQHEAKPGLTMRNGITGFRMAASDYYKLTDPAKAAAAWENGVERPASLADAAERGGYAKKAYEIFGGSSSKGNSDDSILGGANKTASEGEKKDKGDTKVDTPTKGDWGWPFPKVGEGKFADGQQFGNTSYDRTGHGNYFHDGLDFGTSDHPGSEVHAVHPGKVIKIAYMSGLMNYVLTKGEDNLTVVYQEAFSSKSNIKVKVGDTVKTGDVIGIRDTNHLHLGITTKNFDEAVQHSYDASGGWLNPQQVIKNGAGDITGDSGGGECEGEAGDADGNILEIARKLLGYFTYGNTRPILPYVAKDGKTLKDISDVKKDGVTDCSGYVWTVLKLAGYKVPEGGWFTGSMADDAKGPHKYLTKINPEEAKAGDLIIANIGSGTGQNGHTAILTEDYKPNNQTKIIQEGGGSRGGVNESNVANSFGYLLSGEVIYARPVGSSGKGGSKGGKLVWEGNRIKKTKSDKGQNVINLLSKIPGGMNGGSYHKSLGIDSEIDKLSVPEACWVLWRIEGPGWGQTQAGYAGRDSAEADKALERDLNKRYNGSIHELLKHWGTYAYNGY